MNEKFDIYLKLLDEYNKKVNLVSSTQPQTVFSKHFEDSLAISKLAGYIDLNAGLNVVDVGIGGGFPGVPIAIEYPNIRLCAVDSVEKKLTFIRELTVELGISDRVEVVKARGEELGRDSSKREFFDVAVTRAVAKLNVISEYCLPLVKIGGYFVAYKAKNIGQEIKEAENAISTLGGEFIKTVAYTLSDDEERNLVLIKKVKPTPERYPRRAGVPEKRPL